MRFKSYNIGKILKWILRDAKQGKKSELMEEHEWFCEIKLNKYYPPIKNDTLTCPMTYLMMIYDKINPNRTTS